VRDINHGKASKVEGQVRSSRRRDEVEHTAPIGLSAHG
jgi:hypothetical protein